MPHSLTLSFLLDHFFFAKKGKFKLTMWLHKGFKFITEQQDDSFHLVAVVMESHGNRSDLTMSFKSESTYWEVTEPNINPHMSFSSKVCRLWVSILTESLLELLCKINFWCNLTQSSNKSWHFHEILLGLRLGTVGRCLWSHAYSCTCLWQ